ncbi:MAG: Ig-like domain-containing protein, partial [Gallionellaceae bacterium]|nr:Ig-like domain-containing protein [Gallionellaceae bacterium]
ANDGSVNSAPATVTLTVLANRPPVAVNDTASTTRNVPVIIGVLANDTDPDNNINPASVSIVTAPNKGGTATVNANGTVNFTPRLNFRGSDSFSYRVSDTGNLLSNIATVKVNVK